MSRYLYKLYRYGSKAVDVPFGTFTSRKALRSCMKALPYSPSKLADKFFLMVITPEYFISYDFISVDDVHLRAVPSKRIRRLFHA